ncbi:glutamine amidotransferase [Albidovulum sediminis]|jgi:GMP synthase (glutamine-hydrolysing)|uniref:Glutamine amidotransferase n=1 Tax=Albidovulum sediminis TaxID=3066345 RepID=A0ABT2NUN4_9RHOB|nr:glutamine amidotransferase [Defluviimonas sediminis]MCT8331649.1 glutamine amidotransferase [Defluviimonas sediminis]
MTAIAITHVAFEDAGLLQPVLAERGIALRTCPAWAIPDEAEYADLVILLGGPISVNDAADYPFLRREIDLARTRIAMGRPTIGICLGAQIMACAIGGTVGSGPAKEIGWAPVELTAAGRASALEALDGIPVLHWHGEVCHLPPQIPSLAATAACATQAFAPGPRALALQFHAEAGAQGIEPWLVGHTLEIAATSGIGVTGLRADTARHGLRLETAARAMFHRWLAETGVGA